jgi:hypothetical protein
MSRRTQENLVVAGLLAVFAGVIWLCQDFGPRARMIPLPLAVAGIVLALIQLAWQNLRSTEELQMRMIDIRAPAAAEPGDKAAQAGDAGAGKGRSWRREAGAYGIVAALLGSILIVGLLPAVFLFTGGYLLVTRYRSWLGSLTYTAIFTAAVYLLFVVALEIHPYHGLLATLFE